MFDYKKIREDFPILKRKINNLPFIYFDNAATTQKPRQVIEALKNYYYFCNANIHRSSHTLALESTEIYEKARLTVAKFIGAKSPEEIIFTRNSSESLNLIAYSWGKLNINPDDEVLITEMEHHSNLVPWQVLCKEKRAQLKYLSFNKEGLLNIEELDKLITSRTKLLSFVHISNMLGTINPVKKIIKIAKKINPEITTLIDASQSVPHIPISVSDLDCEFLVFTGHKMLAPMGIGVLYGKEKLLEEMPPFLYGGDMIKEVYFDHSTWNNLPEKFEAGTPNVEGAVGLKAAIEYLNSIGMEYIRDYELSLTKYAIENLKNIPKITIYGPKKNNLRGPLISFNLKNVHPHDVSEVLNSYGIAVRTGHHCAMPLHLKLGIPASVRVSFSFYNTKDEIDLLIKSIRKVIQIFG